MVIDGYHRRDERLSSLYRAMRVIECFLTDETLTLNAIVSRTQLPKTTAFRAIKTFVDLDYLEYDDESREYSLAPKLLALGSLAINHSPLTRFGRPLMEQIGNEFGETIYLNIRTGDERICIASLPCNHPLRVDMPVGHRSPLYAGATAKVLLAGMPDEEIRRYLRRVRMIKLTEITPIDADAIWNDIAVIRAQGFAESHGERIKGVWSVSVPVFNGRQRLAALSILLPAAREEDVDKEAIRTRLKAAAEILSGKLTGSLERTFI